MLEVTRREVKPSVWIRAWHRIQERVRQPRARFAIAKALARLRPQAAPRVSASPAAVEELRRDGITMLPGLLSASDLASICLGLEKCKCFNPWRPDEAAFMLNEAPRGVHVAQIGDAPRLAKLHEIALAPGIVDLVSEYFGCRPVLDSIQAWWSVSGNDEPEEAEFFHRDNDSIRFLKLFIYATDVSELNGPHVFVAGSHTEAKLLERRRLSDAEVSGAFRPEQIRTLTGRAGDAFLEDTWGIHKGQLPREGRRLLLQMRYSLTETVFRSPILVAKSRYAFSAHATSLLHEN